jgi:hypothetical protein
MQIFLAMFEGDMFSNLPSLVDSLDIVPSIVHVVHDYFTNVLHFKQNHLRWMPHALIHEIHAQKVTKAKELFDLINVQKWIGYRGVLTGDDN